MPCGKRPRDPGGKCQESRICTPFILVPAIVATNTLIFSLANEAPWRGRITAIGSLAVVVPALLELFGLVPPSLDFRGGALVVLPRLVDLPRHATVGFLAISSLAVIITGSLAMAPFRAELDEAQRRIRLHAWSLRQMVPDEVFEQEGSKGR
jgi:serine/threonine-protein kinase